MTVHHADIAIVGGGIAGLWTLRRAVAAGYNAVLFEADALGCDQTLASQGMIHGGLKYTLGGVLTGASEAIAAMPDRWRACLAGRGELDLSSVHPSSEHYYMFADTKGLGRLTSFFASKALRGRIETLSAEQFPDVFKGFKGTVYQLADVVLDTPALLSALLEPVRERAYRFAVTKDAISRTDHGFDIRMGEVTLQVSQLVSCAGAGSQVLLDALKISSIRMQRRPLHQVLAHTRKLPAPMFAHCLTGTTRAEPRLTITTHPGRDGEQTLYLGGQIATDGVTRSHDAQLAHAQQELTTCLHWLDLSDARFEALEIDRAEPLTEGARRPDEAYVAAEDGFVQCWPTKLTLTPDAADRVLAKLRPAKGGPRPTLPLPAADVGPLPWA